MVHATAEKGLYSPEVENLKGQMSLVFTSPPFPLLRKKKYGNRIGPAYVEWLSSFAARLAELVRDDGSIVLELGNAWDQGQPTMSTLPQEALLAFLRKGNLHLCEEFICHNPARLPGPAQWVNIERIRVKDAFTRVWWMSPTPRPKADNRRVLTSYSPKMMRLLQHGHYNSGRRPSEHEIGATSFLRDNGGAIPSNVLSYSNTSASDDYLKFCRERGIKPHPARMQQGLAEFFIRFLTDPGDVVIDPFAGSNVTGSMAERLSRRWISVEPEWEYVAGSAGRFDAVIQDSVGSASSSDWSKRAN
jgi:site-specific DNA-methyltransferase (cytosine-N4-specific)